MTDRSGPDRSTDLDHRFLDVHDEIAAAALVLITLVSFLPAFASRIRLGRRNHHLAAG